MPIQIRIRLEAAEGIRAYSTTGGNIGYIPGDELGIVFYVPKTGKNCHLSNRGKWHWRSFYKEFDDMNVQKDRSTLHQSGFDSLEEALVDFAKNSHPSPLEIAGIKTG